MPKVFTTAIVCGSFSKTIISKIRNKIIKYSQKYVLSKQFSDTFKKPNNKSMNDSKKDNDEYNELVKLYEEYNENKKQAEFCQNQC